MMKPETAAFIALTAMAFLLAMFIVALAKAYPGVGVVASLLAAALGGPCTQCGAP